MQQQRGNEIYCDTQVEGLTLVEVVMGQRFFLLKEARSFAESELGEE